ncbi:MAG: tRNA 2-thiouridine(34) synthase MnmA [Ruminococcus sp.]|nr:tRNA 2-thiouridine(34) synthase MnmA [Ruminococcus sp.]
MSGGVDSSVTAKLLIDAGCDVTGATMHLYTNEDIGIPQGKTCCSLNDVEDARSVAAKLGIDFHVFNFDDEFKARVIDNFIGTYLEGGTPNPCIECNKHLKFGSFLDRARLLGFDMVATGHYALIERDGETGRYLLKRSPDRRKDQSYVLYGMTQEQLAHTVFPVGAMTKDEIRRIAAENGLINARKPDSQDICFIPDGDHGRFIEERAGAQPHGDVVLAGTGEVIGEHGGLFRYTVGQRKGLGISWTEPLFVVGKDTERNRLILGTAQESMRRTLTVRELNLISLEKLDKPIRCTAQTRYHQQDAPCTVTPLGNGGAQIEFDEPHKAVCRGQSAVMYDGDIVIGGGIIE